MAATKSNQLRTQKYTPEDRKEILIFSDTHGIPETVDKYGINRGTLTMYRSKAVRKQIMALKPVSRAYKNTSPPARRRRALAAKKAPLAVPYTRELSLPLPSMDRLLHPVEGAYRDGFRDGFRLGLEIAKGDSE